MGRQAIEKAEDRMCLLFDRLATAALRTLYSGAKPADYNDALKAFTVLAAHYAPLMEAVRASTESQKQPIAPESLEAKQERLRVLIEKAGGRLIEQAPTPEATKPALEKQ
jgi:hypothetical protein